jgi:hypothetical protein
MTQPLAYLGIASALILVLLLVAEFAMPNRVRQMRLIALLLLLAVLVTTAVMLWPQSSIETKGEGSGAQWVMVALMYVAMTLGIVAQSYYFTGSGAPAGVSSWIKPTLASPIIFIPLLSSYQAALSSMSVVSIADIMILLVSFQNGFFWKVVFDKQAEAMNRRVAG